MNFFKIDYLDLKIKDVTNLKNSKKRNFMNENKLRVLYSLYR